MFLSELLGGVDFSSREVWLLIALIAVGTGLVVLVIFAIMRGLKLIIPKRKLHDDEYVNVTIRRYWILLIVNRVILAALVLTQTLFGLLHWGGVVDVLSPPWRWVLLPLVALTPLFIDMVFRNVTMGARLRTGKGLGYIIYNKRQISLMRDRKRRRK